MSTKLTDTVFIVDITSPCQDRQPIQILDPLPIMEVLSYSVTKNCNMLSGFLNNTIRLATPIFAPVFCCTNFRNIIVCIHTSMQSVPALKLIFLSLDTLRDHTRSNFFY